MKKLFSASGLLLTMFLAACADFPIENPEQEQKIATRTEVDSKGKDYYWSGGRKIYLDTDYTKMIVDFGGEQELKAFAVNISKENPFREGKIALIDAKNESVRQKIFADKSIKNKMFAQKYSGYDDAPFYMTGDIVMQPKENISAEYILAKCSVDAETVTKTDIGVIVRLKKWDTILSTANAIYESGMVDWCHPDFISQDEKMTNDPYFQYQYYLKNTGQTGGTSGIDINVKPAWAISTGVGIRVAVVDDGVEDHDDLAGRVLNGYTPKNPNGSNSNGGNGRPTSAGEHGQACAGIIAASHNAIYTAGVAPDVAIIPINKYYGDETVCDNAAAIEYAWNPNKGNADVISNSWGYPKGPPNNADVFIQQINNAVNLGRLRNGSRLGCVVVAASGNDHHNGLGIGFPASLPNVITVGAVDKYGYVWYYSCRGSTLDVVAPSGNIGRRGGDVYTLDRMGTYGYESGNYTPYFGGTSAACPQVAGIAALILSERPNLTWEEVRSRIRSTCTKLPGYTFNSSGWNNQVGYGLVNAGAAVDWSVFQHPSMTRFIPVTLSWDNVPASNSYTMGLYISDPITPFWISHSSDTPSFTFVPPLAGWYAVTATISTPGGWSNTTTKQIYVSSNDAYIEGPNNLGPGETGTYKFRTLTQNPIDPRAIVGSNTNGLYYWECGTGLEVISQTPTTITVRSKRTVNDCNNYYTTLKLNAESLTPLYPSDPRQLEGPMNYTAPITLTAPNTTAFSIDYIYEGAGRHVFTATPGTGSFVWEYSPDGTSWESSMFMPLGANSVYAMIPPGIGFVVRATRTIPCGSSEAYYTVSY